MAHREHPRPLARALIAGALLLGVGACALGGSDDNPHALFAQGVERALATVREVVAEPERAERAVTLLEDYLSAEQAFADALTKGRDELRAVNARPDAQREDFAAVTASLNAQRSAFLDTTVRQLHTLRSELHAEEWAVLVAEIAQLDASWEALTP